MRTNKFVREVSVAVIFVLVVSIPSTAAALTISVNSISTNPGDSGYQDSVWSDFESDSETSVVNAGGTTTDTAGNSVSAGTRYTQYAWADNFSGVTTHQPTSDYSVVLDIASAAGTFYDLEIDTTRLGALTLYEDCCWSSTVFSSASIGEVTAEVGGSIESALSMSEVSINGSPLNQEINQASSFTLAGLEGDFQLVLDFEWTSEVWSNNDEGALRLGLWNSATGVSANDYPGPDSRPMADDGHFVDVTATVVSVTAPIPEPSTALLLALGLCGLSATRARKR